MELNFDAYRVAIELLRALQPVLEMIRTHDRNLADQAKRAGTSIPLNVAEGRQRGGRDRKHFYRIALGSTAEVGAALDVALACGYVSEDVLVSALELLDRERAM